MFRNTLLISAMLAATLVTSGCANKKLANQEAFDTLATEKAEQFGGDSEKALENAEDAYKKAKDAELDFYAPLHMEQLRETLKQARAIELEGKTTETIQVSAKVVALYEGGLKNKEKVAAQLPALIQQKNTLDEIKAANILPGDYKSGLDDFKELISLIETGDEGKASKDSEVVLKDLQQIELDVMLTQHWKPAKDTLDKAEDEDADSNAVKTYEYAENLVENAERIIRQSYTDRELVSKTGLGALRASQHALYIGREVASLINMNKAQAETAALKFEDYLGQIGVAIKADDVRHMSLHDQTLALKQFAEEQNAKVAAQYKQQIAELNTQLEQITADQLAASEKAAKAQQQLEQSANQQPNISITVNQPTAEPVSNAQTAVPPPIETAPQTTPPAVSTAQTPAVQAPVTEQKPVVTQTAPSTVAAPVTTPAVAPAPVVVPAPAATPAPVVAPAPAVEAVSSQSTAAPQTAQPAATASEQGSATESAPQAPSSETTAEAN